MPEKDDLDTDLDKNENDVENEDRDDDTDDDGDGDGKDDRWTPPTKAEYEAKMEALKKSRAEVRSLKRGGPSPTTKTGTGKAKDSEVDADQIRADAETAATAKWKPTVVRTAARAALVEAGLILPKNKADATMSRVLRMLEMDDIEVDEDGEIDGLQEQIAEIKADCPDLFVAQEGRRRPTRLDASGRGAGSHKRTAADVLAAQLMGA